MSSLSTSSGSSLSSSSSSARSGGLSPRISRPSGAGASFEYDIGSGSGSGSGSQRRNQTTNPARLESVREGDMSSAGVLQNDEPCTAQAASSRSGNSRQSGRSGIRGQTWSEFLLDGRMADPARNEETMNRRRSATVTMDRKRRLAGAEEELSRRRSHHGSSAVASGSGSRPEQGARPSQQQSSDTQPAGSSIDNAIDLSSSPELSRRQSERSSRQPNNRVEYNLPRWQPDSEVSHCPICNTQFSFFYRKHHCRKCGRVVCASCSPHRITIPRQFIVCPPEQNNRFPLSSTLAPSLSNAHVIDLTADNDSPQTQSRSSNRQSYSGDTPTLNPGLGGGEEVRLCNPCVPDPNPEPPRGYGSLGSPSLSSWASATSPGGYVSQAGARRSTLANYYGSNTGTQGWNVSNHRPHRSVSGLTTSGHPRTDTERELRLHRGRGMIFHPETPEIHRASQAGLPDEGLPSYGSFDYTVLPNFRGHPPRYQPSQMAGSHPYHSPPAYSSPISVPNNISSSHRTQSHGHSTSPGSNRSIRGRTLLYTNGQPVPTGHGRRRHIDEADICPVCNRVLPPRGPDGSEDAREEHIRTCISGHGRSGQSPDQGGTSPQTAALPARMLPFVATEKDCVGEDGNEMECTICMVEYEVGDELARLECLCKFHKQCIVEWFERKQECPVHKVS